MPKPVVRVLLLADTHLGFDLPLEPRVERPLRGPDFFANTRRALAPSDMIISLRPPRRAPSGE